MNETEKGARSDIKPRAPLPWECELDRTRANCRLIRSVGGEEAIAYDVGSPDADYIVHAANAYPGQAAEITRLRKHVALLDECLRHHYYDDDQVSQSLLVEARSAVTTGRMVD
jgi:hypothetical protein